MGCGDGFLGNFIQRLYSDSHRVFVDISYEMINKARGKSLLQDNEYLIRDFGEIDWYKGIKTVEKFDLVISGYSIHHIENEQKQRLYKDILIC